MRRLNPFTENLAQATSAQTVFRQILENFGSEIWLGECFRVFVPNASDLAALSEKLRAHPLVHSVVSARALLPAELLGEAAELQALPLPASKQGLTTISRVLEDWPNLTRTLEETAASFSLAELTALLQGKVRLAQVLSRRATDFFNLAADMENVDLEPIKGLVAAMEKDLQPIEDFSEKLRKLPPRGPAYRPNPEPPSPGNPLSIPHFPGVHH